MIEDSKYYTIHNKRFQDRIKFENYIRSYFNIPEEFKILNRFNVDEIVKMKYKNYKVYNRYNNTLFGDYLNSKKFNFNQDDNFFKYIQQLKIKHFPQLLKFDNNFLYFEYIPRYKNTRKVDILKILSLSNIIEIEDIHLENITVSNNDIYITDLESVHKEYLKQYKEYLNDKTI